MSRPSPQAPADKTRNLVEIPMDQPVEPVHARQAASAPAATTTSAPVDSPAADGTVDQLKAALQSLGIDSSTMTFTPEDNCINNPGGVWTDHELRVTTQDGKSVLLATDLLKKNYLVGACDIQHMLNWTPPA